MTDKSKQIVTTDGTIRDIDDYEADLQSYSELSDDEIMTMAEEDRKKREQWEIVQGSDGNNSWYVK